MSDDVALRLSALTKRYGRTLASDALDLVVPAGEVVAVIGPSGCGKSTLLRLVAGLERPDAGSIEIAGEVVADDRGWRHPEQRRVGLVFQDHALFPHLDVRRNVGFGLRSLSRVDRRDRVATMLDRVHLANLAGRRPHELSGGEQQRVALARALAPDPAVVLFDEPFSSLDEHLRQKVRGEIMSTVRSAGTTAVVVTHDQTEALSIADRVVVMAAGRIEQVGTPQDVFERPANRFVASFMGDADYLPATVEGARVTCEIGALPTPPALVPGTSYDVVLRPHEVAVEDDPHGTAEVVDVEYHGAFVLHAVRLASGARVRSWQAHSVRHPVGTRVRVGLVSGPGPVLLPVGDEAVR